MITIQAITRSLFGITLDLALMAAVSFPRDVWLTKDQQGDRLMEVGNFGQAAETYEDPFRRGVAYYRDGQFQQASASFAQRDDAQSAFNRGNALVLLGEYDDAIASFERALQFRPDWPEAKQNHDIAVARRDRIKTSEDDAGGTGGKLAADKIVFNKLAKNANSTQEVDADSDQSLSEEELSQLWLQRVQTKPGDFLRSKIAYQLAHQTAVVADSNPDNVPVEGQQ